MFAHVKLPSFDLNAPATTSPAGRKRKRSV
jgi:hypothetical protein